MKKIGISKENKNQNRIITILLFGVTFFLTLFWIMKQGSMISKSGDAADIWKTITSFYSGNIYPSYVLYKGFAAVYPYVWFYQLALLLGTNEFFFIMVYHASLFSYIAVIALPAFIFHLTKHRAFIWQRILVIALLFVVWRDYRVFSALMVDLPSCAGFFAAVHCAINIPEYTGKKKLLFAVLTGLFCGYTANISGQYSVAALCVLIYAVVKLIPLHVLKARSGRLTAIATVLLMVLSMGSISLLNVQFQREIIDPIVAKGGHISSGISWMQRAFIYFIDKYRMLYGYQLSSLRGDAILEDCYGADGAKYLMGQAAQGTFSWTIRDYLSIVRRYPVDCAAQYFDRAFICCSIDMKRQSVSFLAIGYTSFYLAVVTLIEKVKKTRDFSANFWLVIGAIASIIPLLVMSVEMRCAITFQALIFGTALLGPALPEIGVVLKNGVTQCRQEKSLRCLCNRNFPWKFLCWVFFMWFCFAHIGDIYAQSGMGTGILFQLW